jgi:hypothetical protein
MNLASVDEPATVGWNFDLYAMVLLVRQITVPQNEHRVFTQVAQSKLVYTWTMLASCSGGLPREEVLLVAAYPWERTFFEFRPGCHLPEV